MNRQVLVVDDELDMCETLAMVLEPIGCEVCAVQSGEAALTAIGERHFELAITDYMMPGLDGRETLAAIRALDPKVVVIVVTGYVSDEVFAACRAGGAFAILRKPFDIQELRRVVDAAFAAHVE